MPYLLKSLLILPIFESIYEWVDGCGHPCKNRCYHMDCGELDIIINHIDQHEW